MARGAWFFFDRLFHNRRLDHEMDEELRSHLELRAADLQRSGLSPEEAHRRAHLEFGGIENYKEQCRETRSLHLLHDFWADLRYGVRMLRKSPGFTAVAVITLALGIGATTAIFSAIEAVLLRPLPFPDPDRIVYIRGAALNTGNFAEWKRQATSYEQFSAYSVGHSVMTGGEEPQVVRSTTVSEGFFPLFGIHVQLGRQFSGADSDSSNQAVAIVSDRLWRTQFGAAASALGRTLVLDDKPYSLVGVMPSDPGPLPNANIDVWLPLRPAREQGTSVVARLKPGVGVSAARAEAEAIAARYPANTTRYGPKVEIEKLKTRLVGVNDSGTILLVLAGAVGFILLIACANVANLLLARAATRRREIGVRVALGATRTRVLRQLMAEALLLSLLGAALGILLANWGIGSLLLLLPYRIPRIDEAHIDASVLGFTVLIAVITAVLCGVAPAHSASTLETSSAIKDSTRTGQGVGHRQVRRALVVAEVAIAMVMLAGAGLLIKTFLVLRPINPGFDPSHKLTMGVTLNMTDAPGSNVVESGFLRQVSARVQAIPGVIGVAAATNLPFNESTWVPDIWIDGKQVNGSGAAWINFRLSTSNFFRLMQMPIVSGRDFADSDSEQSQRVAIINQTMARRYWRGENPVGRRLEVETGSVKRDLIIVGIVRDARIEGKVATAEPELYAPMSQMMDTGGFYLVVETAGDPMARASDVRGIIRSADRNALITNVQSLEQLLAESVGAPRFHATLLGILAALGLVLATVGIYGVISYGVEQRTHEIGVRIALGASFRRVLALIVGEGLALAGAGIAIGMGASLALTRLMNDLLFGVSPTDPTTLIIVLALLAAVALLAAYIPARRATKVDPIVALRYE